LLKRCIDTFAGIFVDNGRDKQSSMIYGHCASNYNYITLLISINLRETNRPHVSCL